MTTVGRPNRQKLNEGIDIFRDAMRSFLAPNLRRVPGKRIEQAVESVLESRGPRIEEFRRHFAEGGTVQGFIDIADFRPLLLGHWDNYFRNIFKNNRAILDECRTVANARNESYHIDEHDTSTTETKYTLLQIATALGRINCPDESRRVQQLHDSILDLQTRELQAEVAQLTLKLKEQNSEPVLGRASHCSETCPCWGMPTERPRICPICNKSFKRKWEGIDAHYKAHHKRETGIPYKQWWNSICGDHGGPGKG